MKKKIIIISIFMVLILITSIVFLIAAIDSYNYDMDPANGIDIMQGMGAAFLVIIGGFVVLYEFDLFYVVYYFLTKKKSLAKSIIVILSNLTLVLVFFSDAIVDFVKTYFHKILESHLEDSIIPIGLLFIYFTLKIVYLILGCFAKKEQKII